MEKLRVIFPFLRMIPPGLFAHGGHDHAGVPPLAGRIEPPGRGHRQGRGVVRQDRLGRPVEVPVEKRLEHLRIEPELGSEEPPQRFLAHAVHPLPLGLDQAAVGGQLSGRFGLADNPLRVGDRLVGDGPRVPGGPGLPLPEALPSGLLSPGDHPVHLLVGFGLDPAEDVAQGHRQFFSSRPP